MSEYSSRVIAAWLEFFPEKSSWYRDEKVYQGAKYRPVQRTGYMRYIKTYVYYIFQIARARETSFS